MKSNFTIPIAISLFSGCTLTPYLNNTVQISVSADLPHGKTQRQSDALFLPFADSKRPYGRVQAPGSASGMDCLMINVLGQGVVPQFTTSPSSPIPWDCLNIGSVSSVAATSASPTMMVSAPANQILQFQMLGIATGQGPSSCAGLTIDNILNNTQAALFDLGDTSAGPFTGNGQTVSISDGYDTATSPLDPSNFTGGLAPDLIETCTQLPQPYWPLYIYHGDAAAGTPITATPPNGTLPPPSNGNSFTQCYTNDPNCPSEGPFEVGYPPYWTTSPNLAARIDMMFPIDNHPVAEYNYLTVSLILDEGFVPGSGGGCSSISGATAAGATGFQVAVFDNQTGAWSPTQLTGPAEVGEENFSNPDLFNLQINYSGTFEPMSGFPVLESGDGIAPGHFIHVTVQSLDAGDGATQCSYLQVVDGQIFLDHVPQPMPTPNQP